MDSAILILPACTLDTKLHHYTSAIDVKSIQFIVPRGTYPRPILQLIG